MEAFAVVVVAEMAPVVLTLIFEADVPIPAAPPDDKVTLPAVTAEALSVMFPVAEIEAAAAPRFTVPTATAPPVFEKVNPVPAIPFVERTPPVENCAKLVVPLST